MTPTWVRRIAAVIAGVALFSGFVFQVPPPWSIALWAVFTGGLAIIYLWSDANVEARAERRAERDEIVRQLEIRDGKRQAD